MPRQQHQPLSVPSRIDRNFIVPPAWQSGLSDEVSRQSNIAQATVEGLHGVGLEQDENSPWLASEPDRCCPLARDIESDRFYFTRWLAFNSIYRARNAGPRAKDSG
jgi:hypothetical protein